MDALGLIASKNYITFSKPIAKEYGINVAILLGSLCSWQREYGGEFWKTQTALSEDTCLSPHEIRKAAKVLVECGVLTVTRKENPAKNFYFVRENLLLKFLTSSCEKNEHLEVEDFNDYNNKETIKKETKSNKQVIGENTKRNSRSQELVDLFNSICVSLPQVTVLSTRRERTINTMLKEFMVEQFTTVFKKAEASKFLTGRNGKAWRANFDWLINASNFVKVLDGNYDDRAANRDGMSDNPEDDLPF